MQRFHRLSANAWRSLLAAMIVALAAMLVLPATAQTFPKFTGFVVDAADILPPNVEAELTQKLDALHGRGPIHL